MADLTEKEFASQPKEVTIDEKDPPQSFWIEEIEEERGWLQGLTVGPSIGPCTGTCPSSDSTSSCFSCGMTICTNAEVFDPVDSDDASREEANTFARQ